MHRVLVIEDEPATQTLYRAMLSTRGIDCTIAGDGEQALAMMRRTRFDAVVLDLLLPKVNGFEVLRELKCTSRDTLARVIVCTAVAEETLRDCTELRLVHRVMFKPFDVWQLADEVLSAAGIAADAPAVVPGGHQIGAALLRIVN
ncbi:MAG TPA: response regulator [Thermoanaerobaculia bacterium]